MTRVSGPRRAKRANGAARVPRQPHERNGSRRAASPS